MSNFLYSKNIYDIELHDGQEYNYRALSNYVVISIETDGITPGLYSMIGLAAVSVRDKTKYFYENIRPITDNYNQEALDRLGLTREITMTYKPAEEVIPKFCDWVKNLYVDKPVIVSDNAAFVFHFVLYYCMVYNNSHFPFTFIPRSISDIYSGIVGDLRLSGIWRHWTKVEKDLTCLSDAKRIAESFRTMIKRYNLKETKPLLKVSKEAIRVPDSQMISFSNQNLNQKSKIFKKDVENNYKVVK